MRIRRLVKFWRPSIMYFAFLCLFLFNFSLRAEVHLDQYFQDNMVLQQNEPIVIWGTADLNEEITVKFDSEVLKTTVSSEGSWRVTFSPRKASFNPKQLLVNNTIVKDILVGEVWLCSGQSNMGMTVQSCGIQLDKINQNGFNNIRFYNHRTIRLVAKEGFTDEELKRCNSDDLFKVKWDLIDASNVRNQSAVSWFFASSLFEKLNVPIGIIYSAVGGSAVNSWIPEKIAKKNSITYELYTKDWLTNEEVFINHRTRGKDAFQNILESGQEYIVGELSHRFMCEPDILFEASISKLKKVNVKGVVWYQGESDSFSLDAVQRYESTLPLMIKGWRDAFNKKSLPFVLIQLPKFERETWPELRAVQQRVSEKVSNTSLVVTIDLGNENNIHPKDKIPVGERVTYAVLNDVYGINAPSYPILKTHKVKENTVLLKFDAINNSVHLMGSQIEGFEIVSNSDNIQKVVAEIIGKNKVQIHLPPNSVELRYLWKAVPKATVFNKNELPLAPFTLNLEKRN